MANWFCTVFNVMCRKRQSSPRRRSELIDSAWVVIVSGQKCMKKVSIRFRMVLFLLYNASVSNNMWVILFTKQRANQQEHLSCKYSFFHHNIFTSKPNNISYSTNKLCFCPEMYVSSDYGEIEIFYFS